MDDKIIEPVTIREQVTSILRRKIVNGELVPDQQLSERLISQTLQISTTPVKEAFRTLQSEGLIYTIPRKGSFVSKMSKQNLLQHVFMRGSLEGVAAFFACLSASDEEIKQMEAHLQHSGDLIARGSLDEEELADLIRSNNAFHSTLRNACKNTYLIGLIGNMRSIDKTIRDASLSKTIYEPTRAHQEHLSILDAIKERNPNLAEQRMVSHTRRVGRFVLLDEDEMRSASPSSEHT